MLNISSFVYSLLLFQLIIITYGMPPTHKFPMPIRIAVAVDEKSLKDLIIVINSVLTSIYDQNQLEFHIVACGHDISTAKLLQAKIYMTLHNCFANTIKSHIVPFTLPLDSGLSSIIAISGYICHDISHRFLSSKY